MMQEIFLVSFVVSRLLQCCRSFWVRLSGVVVFSFGCILLLASDPDKMLLRASLLVLVMAIDCWVIWTETLKALDDYPLKKGSVSYWK